MSVALSTYWRREKVSTAFGVGNLRERDNLVHPDVDRMIKLRWIFRKCDWGYGPCQAGSG
jgi:hypothetical protein